MKKQTIGLMALLVLAFAVPAVTQDTSKAEAGKPAAKEAEKAAEKAAAKAAAKEGATIGALVSKLGDEDFKTREKAYKELKAAGDVARPHLRKALESEDPEVRWRAARLLCLLDEEAATRGEEAATRGEEAATRGERAATRDERAAPRDGDGSGKRSLPLDWHFGGRDDSRLQMHRNLSEHLNGLFGDLFEDVEPFQFRFFNDRIPGSDPFDMNALIEQFRRETGRLKVQIDGGVAQYGFERSDETGSASFKLSIAKDGTVKATVRRTDREGNEKTDEYEAESLDAFKKQFPDVFEEFDLDGFSVSVEWPDISGRSLLGRGLGFRMKRAPLGFARKFQPKILGIYTEEPGKALRAHLGLGEKEGLVITGIAPKTFAEEAGIAKMDVLLSINGAAIGDVTGIRAALAAVEEGDAMKIVVIRGGKKMTLESEYFNRK